MTALVVGAVVLAAAMLAMTPYPAGVFYDDGLYVILAKALATGEGYRFLNLPGSPAATHYPPAYPALLALLWRMDPHFPQNLTLFKFANALLLAVGAVGAYRIARRRLALAPAIAAGAAVGGAVAIPVLAMSGVLFSEPLFLALLCPALLVAERMAEDPGERGPGAVAAGALAGLVVLVRTIGLALPVAAVAMLLARRRWRSAAAYSAAAAALVGPWVAWSAAHADEIPETLRGNYGSYTGWLGATWRHDGFEFALRVIAKNLADLPRPIAALFAPNVPAPGAWAVVAAVAALGGFGLWRARRRAPVLATACVLYAAVVVMWPYAPDRFLWAVWPLLVVLLAAGAVEAFGGTWRAGWASVPRAALAAGAAAAVAGYAVYTGRGVRGGWWATAQRTSAEGAIPLARWVARTTPADAVVATDADPLVYLYTGRRTLPTTGWSAADYLRPAPDDSTLASARRLIDRYRVDYYVVAAPAGPTARAARRLAQPPVARLAFFAPLPGGRGAVFKVQR